MELTAKDEAVLSTSFKTAFLLTADAELAEAAITNAIAENGGDEISAEKLLSSVIASASVARSPAVRRWCPVFRSLATQLRPVLNLPDDLRRSFVLRILVGLPAKECAALLKVSAECVNERAGAAAKELAEIPDAAFQRTGLENCGTT